MKEEKSLQEVGLQFIGIRKGCRWAIDRPSNNQVRDWTSFDMLIVRDSSGNRLWCRNYYNKPWWGNNTFAPIPPEATGFLDDEILEVLVYWNQNELRELEIKAKG